MKGILNLHTFGSNHMMGFLRQTYYDGIHGSSSPTANGRQAKRRRMSTKLAFLKRHRHRNDEDINNATKPMCNDEKDGMLQKEIGDNLGDIPRSISLTLDDSLLLPLLLPSSHSFDSTGSPCDKMLHRSLSLLSGGDESLDMNDDGFEQDQDLNVLDGKDGISSLGEPIEKSDVNIDKEAAAKLRSIVWQTPSLDHLPHYVAALSPALSPYPSGYLPSRALRSLLSLSEHSSDKEQRLAMVRSPAADSNGNDSNVNDATLIPALLAFLKRCPRNSSVQHLALLVLNNLSIPTENKRLIALDYGGTKTLGRLLNKDPKCQMLVIIIVNLTFGDENYPLIDPEDPITRRILNRVVSFIDIWKKRGLPLDFRSFIGVNTGLCSM